MRILIVGGGKVGTYLAHLLLEGGHEITIIEETRRELQIMAKELPADVIVTGNGADPKVLETAGIRELLDLHHFR